jgi:hypothetical protein
MVNVIKVPLIETGEDKARERNVITAPLIPDIIYLNLNDEFETRMKRKATLNIFYIQALEL